MTTEPVLFRRLRDLAEVVGGLSDRVAVAEQRPMTPGPAGTAGASSIRITGTLGNGVDAEFTITHNLNTRFVSVELFENGGEHLNIVADIRRATPDSVTVGFAEPPAPAEFAYVLLGPPTE